MSEPRERFWLLLWPLLLGLVWLAATAPTVISGWGLGTLEALAEGRGLVAIELGPVMPETRAVRALGQLPGDPTAWYSWSLTLLSCLACLVALVSLGSGLRSWTAGTLATLYLYLGPPAWTWSASLGESLVRMALVCALYGLLRGRPGLLVVPLLLAAAWEPGAGFTVVALGVFAGLWSWHRDQLGPWGLLGVLVSALVALPWLFRPGFETLSVSWSGYSAGSLLALVGLLLSWRRGVFEDRFSLQGALLLTLPLLTGGPELAAPLLLGLVAANWHGWARSASPETRDEEFPSPEVVVSVPWSAVGVLLTGLLLSSLFWSTTEAVRSVVLEPASEAQVPYSALVRPASWESQLSALTQEPWPHRFALPEVSAEFAQALKSLGDSPNSSFCLLLPDRPHEDRALSLLAALATGKRLEGWIQRQTLSPPLQACRSAGRNLLIGGPELLVGREAETGYEWVQLSPRPVSAESLDRNRYAPIPLGQLVAVGGLKQSFPPRDDPRTVRGYRWFDAREAFTVSFEENVAGEPERDGLASPEADGWIELPTTPGAYRVVCLSEPEANVRQFSLFPPALLFSGDQTTLKVSRDQQVLLPMELENLGPGVVNLERFTYLRVVPSAPAPPTNSSSSSTSTSKGAGETGEPASEVGQALAWPGILYHQERLPVAVRFLAPKEPGFYRMSVLLESQDRQTLEVEVEPPLLLYCR